MLKTPRPNDVLDSLRGLCLCDSSATPSSSSSQPQHQPQHSPQLPTRSWAAFGGNHHHHDHHHRTTANGSSNNNLNSNSDNDNDNGNDSNNDTPLSSPFAAALPTKSFTRVNPRTNSSNNNSSSNAALSSSQQYHSQQAAHASQALVDLVDNQQQSRPDLVHPMMVWDNSSRSFGFGHEGLGLGAMDGLLGLSSSTLSSSSSSSSLASKSCSPINANANANANGTFTSVGRPTFTRITRKNSQSANNNSYSTAFNSPSSLNSFNSFSLSSPLTSPQLRRSNSRSLAATSSPKVPTRSFSVLEHHSDWSAPSPADTLDMASGLVQACAPSSSSSTVSSLSSPSSSPSSSSPSSSSQLQAHPASSVFFGSTSSTSSLPLSLSSSSSSLSSSASLTTKKCRPTVRGFSRAPRFPLSDPLPPPLLTNGATSWTSTSNSVNVCPTSPTSPMPRDYLGEADLPYPLPATLQERQARQRKRQEQLRQLKLREEREAAALKENAVGSNVRRRGSNRRRNSSISSNLSFSAPSDYYSSSASSSANPSPIQSPRQSFASSFQSSFSSSKSGHGSTTPTLPFRPASFGAISTSLPLSPFGQPQQPQQRHHQHHQQQLQWTRTGTFRQQQPSIGLQHRHSVGGPVNIKNLNGADVSTSSKRIKNSVGFDLQHTKVFEYEAETDGTCSSGRSPPIVDVEDEEDRNEGAKSEQGQDKEEGSSLSDNDFHNHSRSNCSSMDTSDSIFTFQASPPLHFTGPDCKSRYDGRTRGVKCPRGIMKKNNGSSRFQRQESQLDPEGRDQQRQQVDRQRRFADRESSNSTSMDWGLPNPYPTGLVQGL